MISNIGLLSMYQREAKDVSEGLKILLVTLLASIINVVVLIIINRAAHDANNGSVEIWLLIMFLAGNAGWVVCMRHILRNAVIISEEVIDRIRIRLGDKVRKCSFYQLEKLGHADIYTKLSRDTVVVAQSAPLLINAFQCLFLVVFVLMYVYYLSQVAFFVAVGIIGLSVAYYLKNDKIVQERLSESSDRESDLFRSISHVLDGFKEIKMNAKKSDEVMDNLNRVSNDVRTLRINGLVPYADNFIFSTGFFFMLIGFIAFILPNLNPDLGGAVTKLTTAFLFLIGPIGSVVNMITIIIQSNIAIDRIYKMEKDLDKNRDLINSKQIVIPDAEKFKKIQLKDLYFEYTDVEGSPDFGVGPLNLEIDRNEIIYIVGGNGSGKSTFLKLLTGLYYPKYGHISLDNERLKRNNIQSYRELFSIILSEFHLFDKLYGLSQIDEKRVQELLKLMEIEHKTRYEDGRFTNLELSTGQRKRLALIVTYLDDREIYVFDEWAADQDPHFKKYFYETLVPDLRENGKTIVAVTHDDRFFDSADRVLKMDFGKVTTLLDNRK